MAFALGALVTYLAWAWHRGQKSHPFWISSTIAFALSIGRDPSPVFVGLFAIPTIFLAASHVTPLAPLFARIFPSTGKAVSERGQNFAFFALSDLLVVIGVTVRYAATFEWSVPRTWTSGATLIALAGVSRLIGAMRATGVTGSFFMWQGLFLVDWVSEVSGPALIASALGFLALGVVRRRELTAPGLAFGLALLMAALGAPASALLVVGIAVLAFHLGERSLSAWVILAAPLSAASHLSAARYHWSAGLAAGAIVLSWGAAANRMASLPGGSAGRVPAFFAAFGTAGLFWSVEPELLVWLVYAGAVGLAAVSFALGPSPVSPYWIAEASEERDPVWLHTAGWVAIVAAILLETRLVLIGISTGFL